MQSSPDISSAPSLSFTNYSSSSRLAEIAARVVEEFRAEAHDYGGHGENFGGSNLLLSDYEESLSKNRTHFHDEERSTGKIEEEGKEIEDEEEFEFAVEGRDSISFPTPADDIFYNGQIRPCFPLFNQDLLLNDPEYEKMGANFAYQKSSEEVLPPQRLSLMKLFMEDREAPLSSCSSSEADEFDGVQPDSYCVWDPKKAAEMAAEKGRCKKSSSTGSGSSKRWRFRDLLYRSNSDGKDNFVFLSHSATRNDKRREGSSEKIEKSSAVGQEVPKAASGKVAPARVMYFKADGDRRRLSFLPYRQDLVGLFSNVNGLNRNSHPF